MKDIQGYIPQDKRKKILLLSDDLRLPSGVGNMAREIVLNTAHVFNWSNLGAAKSHKEVGRYFDLSEEINSRTGLKDSYVRLMPSNGYGNPSLLRQLINIEKPDGILIFTDPRQWIWLFKMERELRKTMPIMYLNIWDNYPAPMYNRDYYNSCDGLFSISKQTKNINEIVLGNLAEDKVLKYIPHGINENTFSPVDQTLEPYIEFKKQMFNEKEYDFVVLFNSRNIRRKQPGDIILSYQRFCEKIGPEKAKRCLLLMHTASKDANGTDLKKVRQDLTNPEYCNIRFTDTRLSETQMNYLYNLSDVNILISSNEGWGLSLTESMMAGTMNICNVTGGMQDQCRFEDEDGNWLNLTPEFPSNHRGTYKKHGQWVEPVFPASITIQGSVPTPYIYEDRVNIEEVAQAIENVYNLTPEQRRENGLTGRAWATGQEAGFTAKVMGERVIEGCNEVFDRFTPRPSYEVIKVEQEQPKGLEYNILNY